MQAVTESSTPKSDSRYRCGTLLYTKAGLFTLFSWLLWGDFCFSLMETIWPNILPLVLKGQGSPNTILSLVITTIPSLMNFVMNPIISTASDRHRGKRGRRMPFLLFATPFIAIFLILLGFSRELGNQLHGILLTWFPALTVADTTIGLICVLIICFRFFELFVNTVFWYLFNDVVPTAFIGRFLGFFRVVGSLAGAIFHFFLFQYAESHTSWIFFGVAVLYGTVFFLMCLNVKEGEYPPPDKISAKSSPFSAIRTYFRECFTHRIFRRIFAYNTFVAVANTMVIFQIFMAFSLGLTKADVGKVAGTVTLISAALMYPMGVLVDRFHPLRIMLVAQIGFCVISSFNLVFLFFEFPPEAAFWIYAAIAGISIPISVANVSAGMPMSMRLFPHERYGQFCSANAMCVALGTMVGGALAGAFLDALSRCLSTGNVIAILGRTVPSNDFYFRFIPLWTLIFMMLAFGTCYLVYREWKKLGGDKNYRPPLKDKFADFHGETTVIQ